MKCETVKVDDSKGGFFIINKSDFDQKEHKLFKEKPEQKQEKKKPAKKAK